MKLLFLTFSFLLLLTSCGEITQKSKTEISPGCFLYTLERNFTYIYTTICETDKQESTSYAESCGKSCTRNVEIKTVRTP